METAPFSYILCMKRRILEAIIIAAMAMATQQAMAKNHVEVELTKASGSKTPNVLTLKTDVGEVRTFLEISQDEDKRIVLKAPPFASMDISDMLLVGELSTKGLLSLTLDPFNGPIPYKGFEKNGNVSVPSNLSLSPTLSGIAFCTENMDIVALNPVSNPDSPMGLGFVAGNERAFVSVLTATQNSMLVLRASPKMQVDWRHLGYGRHMLFSMVGTSFKGNVSSLGVEGSFFLQNAWDRYLGGGTNVGMGMKLGFCDMTVELERHLGGIGVKLKALDGKPNPVEDISISCSLGRSFTMGCSYSRTSFAPPLYGGLSQEHLVEFGVSLKHEGFSISCTNCTHYETDRGKSPFSLIEASWKLVDAKLKFSTRLERPLDQEPGFKETTFSFSNPCAQLVVADGKTTLKFRFTVIQEKPYNLEMAIDQDRVVSLKLSLGE